MVISEVVKEGLIQSLSGRSALVRISSDDAADSKENVLVVRARIAGGVAVKKGDRVMVVGRLRGWVSGWFLLAGLPFLAILCALLAGFVVGLRQGAIAVAAVGVMFLYYAFLYFCLQKVVRQLEWIVGKPEEQCGVNTLPRA